MRLRTFTVALILGAVLLAGAPQAGAESGWAWRNKAWVAYHFKSHAPASLEGRGRVVFRAIERETAIRKAVRSHRTYLHRIKRLLAQARTIISQARSVIGFPASCVALAEEGGHNSWAGYFGFISNPSSYGPVAASLARTYGESWLNWPYGAQLQVALDLYGRYGGSPWGSLTRSKCGI